MQVFKFGGASVKDAEAVKNLAVVLKQVQKDSQLCVVISAMGKTTNALEELTNAFFYNAGNPNLILEGIKKFHFDICNQLFLSTTHPIYQDLENTFVELHWSIEDEPTHPYDFEYDQIISIGEVLSAKIVSAYLNSVNVNNTWIDARGLIQTDNTYRDAVVDFDLTEALLQKEVTPLFLHTKIIITQGFIGGTSENFTTTLGREGSDYTASIIAYCLNAESVTIWKDVPGVLNADPKWFNHTKKIDELSYQDAIELTYYGATVIHPKTIKPLQNKNIPLYVKSFLQPEQIGTIIKDSEARLTIPSYIFKINQVLISIQPKDFSFIAENNLSYIFEVFSKHLVKINLMQLSAISFSVCCDNDRAKIDSLVEELQTTFKILYNSNLELMTVRYYTTDTISSLIKNKIILLEQRSRFTVQMVLQNEIDL